ncbi:membrane-bound O-acyltransferase domain-containing protein 2-like isoform X1 [Poecilia latipinna]|uniref:Membrane bound O-acyltransferase domain containing 2 n=2 Tax=Poecilia latipinna TaxID=48699 RepID=A0A3B3VN39_9TELE|nr:PREDICTED: membrane-bound O-acyltransferase domain-containing protein 2-like isoform X1 [Poecilia latipinna]
MATQTTASCTGSTLLQPISEIIDLPLDQVNFVACQLFALLMAVWFRLYLHPSKTSPFIRHVVATLLGLYLALFCFGWYSVHFLVQSGLSYGVMIFASLEHMHKYCFIVTLGYLILCQITRVYVFDYGMYSADFTGPMMVITQKITSMAFEIHDGLSKRREGQLTPSQKYLAISRMPSLLEYLSYNCNFMGILAGPTCSYNDYMAFMEGTSYQRRHQENANGKENGKAKKPEPSPKRAVVSKLCTCAISLTTYLSLYRLLPVDHSIDEYFVSTTPFYLQVVYLYLAMLALRPKYYFVWTLADAINNAAGFGFNGYDTDGSPRWDLISNLRILDIEFATSFKLFLDNWNIQTAQWLKRVCYERCPVNPTTATFLLSAMWHGVYPGYYLTFVTGIGMTMAARAVRHNIRPYFLVSDSHKRVYDVITWASTQVAICYTVVPFVLLAVGPSLKFYSSWYFCLHLLCLLVVLVLPVKSRRLQARAKEDAAQDEQRDHSSTDNNCNQKDKST